MESNGEVDGAKRREETTIAKRISAADGQNPADSETGLLDSAAKGIIATRNVLAWIVKYCIHEAADLSIKEIAEQCIEPDILVSASPVYREDAEAENADPGSARIESTEDASVSEGVVRYDILFKLKLPGENEAIAIIVNVELQNRKSLPYPLESRAVSYGSRLVGRQGTDYGNLKKVYSIWIVSLPGEAAANSTVTYRLMRRENDAEWEPASNEADLMEIVFLNLGDAELAHENSTRYGDLLELLDILFSGSVSADEKKTALESKFGIPMSKEMYKDMETVTTGRSGFEEAAEARVYFGLVRDDVLTAEDAAKRLEVSLEWFKREMQAYIKNEEMKQKLAARSGGTRGAISGRQSAENR